MTSARVVVTALAAGISAARAAREYISGDFTSVGGLRNVRSVSVERSNNAVKNDEGSAGQGRGIRRATKVLRERPSDSAKPRILEALNHRRLVR